MNWNLKVSRNLVFWVGLWLLANSWLFGLDYFFKGNSAIWSALVAAGTMLICLSRLQSAEANASTAPVANAARWPAAMTVLLLIPVALLAPWPYRIAPVVMAGGVLVEMLARSCRWLRAASAGMSLSGTVLFAQTLALLGYKHFTASSHELPWPLPDLLAGILQLLGTGAAASGSNLVLPTMRVNHQLGATWELFLDPATLCFLAGALTVLLMSGATWVSLNSAPGAATTSSNPRKGREPKPTQRSRRLVFGPGAKAIGLLLLAAALWLPLRAGLHAALFLHRALRTDYEAPLSLMNQFWSQWPQLLLLLPLVLLTARWLRNFPLVPAASLAGSPALRPLLRAGALSFGAVVVLTLAVLWDPIGTRKPGRIAVDEYHSKWEPTDRSMDTEWYGHLSGYNYACLYDYYTRFYQMSRLTNSLTDAALASLDVLILKVPTEKFQPAEVDAIVRFVERGGGVLMIGEHTDVFGTGYHLNSVSRRFGFTFRYDCLFGMESFFDQLCALPLVRHPVLQFLREFDFATSCSIDTGGSSGRGVIVSTGLKNSMADYHANNYYPQAVDHAAMRYGAFVQLWATRHKQGRVVAFTDSTIFSNFSTFEPGKIELLTGMIEWLNRQDHLGNPRTVLLVLGMLLLLWALWYGARDGIGRALLLAAGTLGWSAACAGLIAYQRSAMVPPTPVKPLVWVTIDRTVCEGILSKGGFIAGKPDGYGIFERWILRLGYFIKRVSGPDALRGDLVLFFNPTKPVTAEFREATRRYVEGGGRVLIVDSPKNEKSSAAELLEPFGLKQKPLPGQGGTVSGPSAWPAVRVDAANEITGGKPLFRLDGKPVGAVVRHGKGTVVLLGFGSRFTDAQMGATGDVVPDAELRKVFDLQFALLRAIIQDQVEVAAPAN